MKKTALWGYGGHGRDMELILTECWSGLYRITAVFDRNNKQTGKTDILGLPVRPLTEMEEAYRNGVFDTVLVTVYDPAEAGRISVELAEAGIPEETLDIASTMCRPQCFPLAESPVPYPEGGYVQYCFSDAFLHATARHRIPFIFDREGRINDAYWHPYQRKASPYAQYYRPDAARFPIVQLSGEWALLTGLYGMNYWHFTYETMSRMYLLEKHGYQGRYLLLHSSFTEELCALADVAPERIVWVNELDPDVNYRIERLVHPVTEKDPNRCAAPVLAEFAEKVRQKLSVQGGEYADRIYVQRIGRRRLDISREWLERNGFRVMVPEDCSVAEQIRWFMYADIVLSPHGANTTNSLYMNKGSVLIETFPSDYINPTCMETCKERGVHYLMVTEMKHSAVKERKDPDVYRIPELMLDLALDAAVKLTEHRS
ncbi:MAG: glycosyltransferase 61 family protein [Solobacterium sp.]|nr:glycosyltransferase 61 family protein [Solobacterium sp.]